MTTTGERLGSWFTHLPPTRQSLLVILAAGLVGASVTAAGKDWFDRQGELPRSLNTLSMKVDSLSAKVDRFEEALLLVGSLQLRIEGLEKRVDDQRKQITIMCLEEGHSAQECVK